MTDNEDLKDLINESERRQAAALESVRENVFKSQHEHGKQISRLEGVMEARHQSYLTTQASLRDDFRDLNVKLERFEEALHKRLTAVREVLSSELKDIQEMVTEGKIRQGTIMGIITFVAAMVAGLLVKYS